MRLLALAAVVGGAVLMLNLLGVQWSSLVPERIRAYIHSFGWWAPLVYVVLYSQPVVPLPASVMVMAAGLAFGMVIGIPLAYCALVLRAYGQFALARWLGREAIERLLSGRWVQLDHTVERLGFQAVLWFRLIPNVPYDVQNFSLGLSAVHFRAYALATLVGALPGTILWVYVGHTSTGVDALWRAVGLIAGLLALGAFCRWLQTLKVRPCPKSPV
jgi:uncharacterized membrane protein YdjX (TVP38/TMEM64 family)